MSVLVADDDRLILDLLSRALAMDGWEVWQATTGDQAVEVARAAQPTVALLDALMPGRSGIEAAEELAGEVPLVIFVTALEDRTWMLRGVMAGAADWLNKPVDPDEVIARTVAWAESSGIELVSPEFPGVVRPPPGE